MRLAHRKLLPALLVLFITVFLVACAKKARAPAARTAPPSTKSPGEQATSASSLKWTEVATPYPAGDITAVRGVFWICGTNEMIASSSDGGNSWRIRHQKSNGPILLRIGFINEKVGFAAGTSGSFLSTTDGGKSWKSYKVDDDVQSFSFANSNDGIAVIGGEDDDSPHLDGTVKLTHDGGKSWRQIPALGSDELRDYNQVLSVAALDSSHYLMIRRRPGIEDVFVVTRDGGVTWKVVHPRNDETNREFPRLALVHDGEYWVFGWELVNRKSMGGYDVAMTMHSPSGETWVHGKAISPRASASCNQKGCRVWDGVVANLYGENPQYRNLPQDFTMTWNWAVAGDRVCTINTITECGPAIPSDKPQPSVWRNTSQPFNKIPPKRDDLRFEKDCLKCEVEQVMLDPGLDWQGTVVANFDVDLHGAVMSLYLDGKLDDRLRDRIENQVQRWIFKAPDRSSSGPNHRRVAIDVRCIDVPGAPAIDGCRLSVGEDKALTTTVAGTK